MSKKPVRTFVIDEDQNLENLRKIIKRDFIGNATAQEEAQTLNYSLNSYISNYKSNENQLFSQLVHINNQEWKEKHWWIDKQDKMLMIAQSEQFKALPYHNMLEKESAINGIDTSLVKQNAKNAFFFNKDSNFGSLHGTEHEQAKKIFYANCRLDNQLNKARQAIVKQEQITPLRPNSQRLQSVKIKKNDKPSQFQEDGHMMTWGEIQSTPMRIAGPEFKIPDTPQREILLNSLNHKIKKEKLQTNKKSEHVMKILGSLTPSWSTSRRVASSIRVAQKVGKSQHQKEKSELLGMLNFKK